MTRLARILIAGTAALMPMTQAFADGSSESQIINGQINLDSIWTNNNMEVNNVNGDVNGSATAVGNAFQAVTMNNTTVWSDPRSRSQIAPGSYVRLARTAERGKFDFFFLSEGLRLREHKGHIYDLDVVGRPENLTMLSALAAVTTRLGLAATVNTTFN